MVCGNAAGELLPPMVIYKAAHLYENWRVGGPPGTLYDVTQRGWFDCRTFGRWFKNIFLPFVENKNGAKILIGDNLASHFDPETVKLAKENNIYFSSLPPNSTHLTQPLDVGFFRPFKAAWRNILDKWRVESRSKGSIPKQQLPLLFNRLFSKMEETKSKLLKSAFASTGLFPLNPQEVLKRLPQPREVLGNNVSILNAAVEDLLKENRGWGTENKPKIKRGKKVVPGSNIAESAVDMDEEVAEDDEDEDEDSCTQCKVTFGNYRGPDWVACITCSAWFCGKCYDYDIYFLCPQCK